MSETSKQRESHEFLDYHHLEIHFIYGFVWRSFDGDIPSELFINGLSESKAQWLTPLIHERIIGRLDSEVMGGPWVGAYQPTFVLKRRCLEKSGYIEGALEHADAYLVAPLYHQVDDLPRGQEQLDTSTTGNRLALAPVKASWTLRLFDSGSGTMTLRIALHDLSKEPNRAARFQRIHWLLRLVPNIDAEPECHELNTRSPNLSTHPLTDSFLFTPALGCCRLYDIMQFHRDSTLRGLPEEIGLNISWVGASDQCTENMQNREPTKPRALTEYSRASVKDSHRVLPENQTPYVFITTTVPGMECQLDVPSLETSQEVASIFSRLTLDNKHAAEDFLNLSPEYMCKALGFADRHLPNYSHDKRIFFTFSKRGAIAVVPGLSRIPHPVFVIPSLLNLFELLRARLVAGVGLTARLAEVAAKSSRSSLTEAPVQSSEYIFLRALVASNLENPLYYLFDGGSVTELGIEAERVLMVSQIWEDVRRSFAAVDRIRTEWQTQRVQAHFGGRVP